MAGKPRKTAGKSGKARRNKRNRTFSKIVSVLIIIFAAGYFLYKNVPEFKDFTDSKIASAKTAAEKILGKNETARHEETAGAAESKAKDAETNENAGTLENAAKTQNPQAQDERKTSAQEDSKEKDSKISAAKPSKNALVALEKNLEIPLCAGLRAGTRHAADHERRNYEYYSICYRESYEQAEWSAYCLTREHLVKNASRSDDFREDPEISTGSATLADYKGSGYDRGHLSPAADFSFDKTAMSETFYMSNMSPQAGSFNRGIWKDLESTVRGWAEKFGRVYVVSGPVLEKPAAEYESIGADKVSVPQYYYKVLLAPLYKDEKDAETPDDAEGAAAIGFIFPNEKCAGTIFDYAASVDEVEKRTGLDFFSELDDTIENKVEAELDLSSWK